MADPALERKYALLRRRLDHLGYRQALGFESIALVERIFADLVHTTESLKSAKAEAAQAKKELSVWEHQVEPLRRDNARLINENNLLHVRVIDMRESSVNTEKELKEAMYKMEAECRDLRFVNSQYVQRLRAEEAKNVAKSERISQLLEKNLGAVISTPDGGKKAYPPRRPRIEIKSPSKTPTKSKMADVRGSAADSNDSNVRIRAPAKYPGEIEINTVEIAERRIERLSGEVEQLKGEKRKLESKIESDADKMGAYRAEMQRLGKELEARQNVNRVHFDETLRAREREISMLKNHIDVLEGRLERDESSVKGLAGSDASGPYGNGNGRPSSSLEQEQALAERVIVQNRELMGRLKKAQATLAAAREAYCELAGVDMDEAEFAAAIEGRSGVGKGQSRAAVSGAVGAGLKDIESRFGELQSAVDRFQRRNEELEKQVARLSATGDDDVDNDVDGSDDGVRDGKSGRGDGRREGHLIEEISELRARNAYLCRELESIQDLMLRMDGGSRDAIAAAGAVSGVNGEWLRRVRIECHKFNRMLGRAGRGRGDALGGEEEDGTAATARDLADIEDVLASTVRCATECARMREDVARLEKASERHLAEERMWRSLVDQSNGRRDGLASVLAEKDAELEDALAKLAASEGEVQRLSRSRNELLKAVEALAEDRIDETDVASSVRPGSRGSHAGSSTQAWGRASGRSSRSMEVNAASDEEGDVDSSVVVHGDDTLDDSGRWSAGRSRHVELLRRVLDSNDQLERRLEDSERKLADLAKEREKILFLYKEALDRNSGEHADAPANASAAIAGDHINAVVEELEAQRDTLSATLRRTKLECEQLRLRLAKANAHVQQLQSGVQRSGGVGGVGTGVRTSVSVSSENGEDEDDDEGMGTLTPSGAFAILQKENKRMSAELIETRRRCDEIEEELRAERSAKLHYESELDASKKRAEALSDALDRTDNDVSELNANTQVLEGKLREADDQVATLSSRVKIQTDEIVRLRAALASLDRRRDELDDETARHVETIAELRAQNDLQAALVVEKEGAIDELERELERAVARHRETEREFGALRTVHDRVQRDKERAEREKAAAETEVARMRTDDVQRLQRENQSLHRDLELSLAERDDLAKNVQRMARELLDVNELMAMKERERSTLMDSLRSLSDEREDLEDSIRDVAREKKTALTRAEASERIIEDLRRRLAAVAAREEAYTEDVTEFTEHAEALSQTILELETRLKAALEEREAMRADVQASRDMAANVSRSRESLQRRIASLEVELGRAQQAIADANAEKETNQMNVAAERGSRQELEAVVGNLRSQLSAMDAALNAVEGERDLLMRKVTLADDRVRDLSARIAETAQNVEERDRDRETLRRQVESAVVEMEGLRAQLEAERRSLREVRLSLDKQTDALRRKDDEAREMRRQLELTGMESDMRVAHEEQRSHRLHEQYRQLLQTVEQVTSANTGAAQTNTEQSTGSP